MYRIFYVKISEEKYFKNLFHENLLTNEREKSVKTKNLFTAFETSYDELCLKNKYGPNITLYE